MSLIGTSVGRYHILDQLGQGGMATVYKAYDTRLEREVAIKIIRREAFPPEQLERILKRFEREAKSMAKMSHASIVKVYDYGEYDGAPYLVMEYLPGQTLKEQMNQPMNYHQAAWVLVPIAHALHYAHQRGILHRDVKPSNILINDEGLPMLTDFGVAKLLEDTETGTLTGTGVGVGTPEYMAPEQGLGKEVDGRVDVYALGVVLYELITGRKPFQAETPLAVLYKQMNDPLPRPMEFVSSLPDKVEHVLFKALAKQPEDRYPDMEAFALALEKFAQGGKENNSTLTQEQSGEVQQVKQKPVQGKNSEPLIEVRRPTGFETVDNLPVAGKQGDEQLPKWLLPASLAALGMALVLLLVFEVIVPAVARNRSEITATAVAETSIQQTESVKHTGTAEAQAAAIKSTQQAAARVGDATQQALKTAALFEEDFEDGKTQGVTYIAGEWKIVEDETGNHVYELDNSKNSGFPGFDFGTPQWRDYAIQFRMRILNPGEGLTIVYFRSSDAGAYCVSIDVNMTSLIYTRAHEEWIGITTREHHLEKNQWYDISIEADGEEIKVFIDGEIIIITDDTKFKTGIITIQVGQYSYIQLDDISVRDLHE